MYTPRRLEQWDATYRGEVGHAALDSLDLGFDFPKTMDRLLENPIPVMDIPNQRGLSIYDGSSPH